MYRLSKVISNPVALNLIPDISFSPSGSMFAVTHLKTNELVVFDSRTRSVLRVFRNPDALLDEPHGVHITNKHIIVTNRHGTTRPSSFSVYSLATPSDAPVSVFEPPYQHLREAHSLTMHNGVLAATYCQNTKGLGALVTYDFDDETGEIKGAIAIRDSCFPGRAEPKGVAFNSNGSCLFVTYTTDKSITGLPRYTRLLKEVRNIWKERGGIAASRLLLDRVSRALTRKHVPGVTTENGIVKFEVDDKGVPSSEPIGVLGRNTYCRLENIAIIGDTAVISDIANGTICLYDLKKDSQLDSPIQTITEKLNLPHGAKLSPDRAMLVVTDFGLEIENQAIQWGIPSVSNGNRVLVYDLHG